MNLIPNTRAATPAWPAAAQTSREVAAGTHAVSRLILAALAGMTTGGRPRPAQRREACREAKRIAPAPGTPSDTSSIRNDVSRPVALAGLEPRLPGSQAGRGGAFFSRCLFRLSRCNAKAVKNIVTRASTREYPSQETIGSGLLLSIGGT